MLVTSSHSLWVQLHKYWNMCVTNSKKRILLGLGYDICQAKWGTTFVGTRSKHPSEFDQSFVRKRSWNVLDNLRWLRSGHFNWVCKSTLAWTHIWLSLNCNGWVHGLELTTVDENHHQFVKAPPVFIFFNHHSKHLSQRSQCHSPYLSLLKSFG